jgi:rhomboid protease GluP
MQNKRLNPLPLLSADGNTLADVVLREAMASSQQGVEEVTIPHPEEDTIPVIGDHMLHRERVDLEAGMSVFPLATIGLIAACSLIFLDQLRIDGLAGLNSIVDSGAMDLQRVQAGEVWRVVSAGFLHAGVDHLIGNMVMLYILGMACEHAFGVGPFLFLYVASCISGSLLTLIPGVPMVGASGAIFGLAGALIGLTYRRRHTIEVRDRRLGFVLAAWSVYTIARGLFNPYVSNSAHLGGLIGGLALGWILPPSLLAEQDHFARRPGSLTLGLIAMIVLAATAVFFLPRLL